jgi:plasmid stabilization system protein ParE
MKVVFSPRSVARLREIQAYIAYDNVTAAVQAVSRIRHVRDDLKLAPVWMDGPTPALVVSGLPYRLHHRVNEPADLVEIITVAHTSQRLPRFDGGGGEEPVSMIPPELSPWAAEMRRNHRCGTGGQRPPPP